MSHGAVTQALDLLEESTVPNTWKRDNPAEAEAIQMYRDGETTGRPTARTKFGQALLLLIDASKVYEEEREKPHDGPIVD